MVWASADPEGWEDRVDWSDALDRVGWWDEHCVPNSLMRRTVKRGEVPALDGYELVNHDQAGNLTGRIRFLISEPGARFRLSLFLDGEEVGHIPWREE